MAASAPARLITIPISHYCEKARWALDRAAIAYREERHVQIVHRVASRRAGGGGTVPVLVAPDGVFTQSADILAYADRHTEPAARLYPEDRELRAEVIALERDFDAGLGPEGRRWMYFHILPERDLGARVQLHGGPRVGAAGVPADARRHVGLHPPPVRHRARDRGRRPAPPCRRRSTRSPRAWTTAGATCAATPSRPPTSPSPPWPRPSSSRPSTASRSPSPTSCRPTWPRRCEAFRAHPAGAFALRLFREER